MSVSLSLFLSVFVCLPACLSVCLSVCLSLSACLPACLPAGLSVCLSVCLSLSLSLSVCLSLIDRGYIWSCSRVPCSSLFSGSCHKDSAQIPSTSSTANYSSSEQLTLVKLRYIPPPPPPPPITPIFSFINGTMFGLYRTMMRERKEQKKAGLLTSDSIN